MKVILNDELEDLKDKLIENLTKYPLNDRIIGKLTYKSKGKLVVGPGDSYISGSMFTTLSLAYSNHMSFRLKPDDLVFLINTEISKGINKDPEKYRSVFVSHEGKETILLPSGSDIIYPVLDLIPQFAKRLNENVDIFKLCPHFTTSTAESFTANVVSIADGLENYFSYLMYCCGIRSVEVLGTQEDWQRFKEFFEYKKELFSEDSEIKDYIDRISPIIERLTDDILSSKMSMMFWKNIFTQENAGSGGDLIIDGWMSDLFFEIPSTRMIHNYSETFAEMSYKNVTTNRNFKAYHGAVAFDIVGDALETKYNQYIFEVDSE